MNSKRLLLRLEFLPNRTRKRKMRIATRLIVLMLLISIAESATMAQRRKTVVDLIVSGGTVVTMDGARRVIENGAIAIKAGPIEASGRAGEIGQKYAAREGVSATGKIGVPGPINGHT